jgi:aryl carrier-like protein
MFEGWAYPVEYQTLATKVTISAWQYRLPSSSKKYE